MTALPASILATLFYHPMTLRNDVTLIWLLIPICLSVAIIYKTVRVKNLRSLVPQVGLMMVYMLAGMAALCVGLYLIQLYGPSR